MIDYYDRTGRPIDSLEWLMRPETEHRVAETTLPNGLWISTVWLGLDHQIGAGPPLIFETMVFPRKGNWHDLECQRYPTEADATAGHAALVEKWTRYDPKHGTEGEG